MSINRKLNRLNIKDTTDTTTLSTGSLIVDGGISSLKNISIGANAQFFGTNSNYTAIKSANTANNIVLTLPSSLPAASGSYLIADVSGNFSFSEGIASVSSSFVGTQSATNANITDLVYTTGNFEINVTVNIIATTNLTEIFKLSGILSSGPSGWNLTTIAVSGDESNINFTITNAGQIKYTSPSYAGFVSLTFTWSNYISTAATVNLVTGINSVEPLSSTSGVFFNVNGATATDTVTASSGTLPDFHGSYISRPTLAATNTLVTTTNANTVYIAGEPIAGTNETLVNKFALNVKGKVGLSGSTSGVLSLIVPASFTSYNWNFPSTAGSSGQVLTSAGGGSSVMTWSTVSTTTTTAGTFSGANNQTSEAPVTGLIYATGDEFKIDMFVAVDATTKLKEYFILYGIKSDDVVPVWNMTSTTVAGTVTGVQFFVTGTGQINYTSLSYTGFVSLNMRWK